VPTFATAPTRLFTVEEFVWGVAWLTAAVTVEFPSWVSGFLLHHLFHSNGARARARQDMGGD